MARPKKNTIDYFSHDAVAGKTMFILEQRFGNDGYAFWFKLLELLCVSDGHYIDTNNPTTWEFLVSKTRVPEVSVTEMLSMLSKLEAIDPKLWEKGIIWSDGFIQRIDQVYKKRGKETPARPSFCDGNPGSPEFQTPETPQSKVKESKGKESRCRGTPDGEPPASKKKQKEIYSENDPAVVSFREYCEKRHIENGITNTRYLEMREEFSAKTSNWWREVRACVDWLYDHGKQKITASRLRRWMEKSLQIARDQELRRQQSYNDAKMALMNRSRMPDTTYDDDLKARADSGEPRARSILPNYS